MISLVEVGNKIKNKRLSLNMRMDDVARQADISRATLWSIEKGIGNYTFFNLVKVFHVLNINLNIETNQSTDNKRIRATRIDSIPNKAINRFVLFTVEQYAKYDNKNSRDVYKLLKEKGIVDELINDYEDLHGMSTMYLNDYIDALLKL